MTQSPKKTPTKPFVINLPQDGYDRVIDEVLDTMDKNIPDVVGTLDLSIFGVDMDLDTAVQALQPMIISMQDSLIDIIAELEYDDGNVPRDWMRHQYAKDQIPNDALGHFTGIEDVRGAMEKLADRIKQQMSYGYRRHGPAKAGVHQAEHWLYLRHDRQGSRPCERPG